MDPKIKIKLIRYASNDQGTRGVWQVGPLQLHTMELPWRDNRNSISRIPRGQYPMYWIKPRRAFSGFRELYYIDKVHGRTGILVHPGTVAGDVFLNYKTHSWGCILLGKQTGICWGQSAIFNSRAAVREFHDYMQRRPATLIVEDEQYVGT